jgi:response regulator RpfG family c-di-GMP phosphodiesterase
VLDRLGAGGMGVVYKAEHAIMRRLVAIKVLPMSQDQEPRLLLRFYSEIRAISQLQHPNIVTAMDAGELPNPDPDGSSLHYLVMEYVKGQDLEALVEKNGPLTVAQACDLACQVARGLAQAHDHKLVHRDIKPSNVLVTAEGQAKLLDFGLARQFTNRMTEPGTVLGSIDYMSPEQARDASRVDIRTDIYGLGGTLFWCLTGKTPFPPKDSIVKDLACRMTQPPPSARSVRSQIPAELDTVIARMMAINPDDRYATPQALMRALLPFLSESRDDILPTAAAAATPGIVDVEQAAIKSREHRVLIADDELGIRAMCRCALQMEGIQCEEAVDGARALEIVRSKPFDLVLLDINMPELSGREVLRQLRENGTWPNLKVIMFSGQSTPEEMAPLLLAGADDYLTKPFSVVQLQSQIKASLRLKDAQDRTDLLNRHLLGVNHELEQNLNARDSDLVHARNALVLALAKLVEYRDSETSTHLTRLQRYCRVLAEEAAGSPLFANQIDQNYVELLACCAPLHDIGKVGLPDHILLKPGKLDADERIIMQAHTIIGSDTLRAVAQEHGSAMVFLQMAIDIARHHHERFDGKGYPDRLAGNNIPLAARIVTVCDVYDALRSRRVYKPALSHIATVQIISEGSDGQFDPTLIHFFQRCAGEFERIFRESAD